MCIRDRDVTSETIKPSTQTFVIAGAFRTNHHPFDMASVFVERDAFLDWTGTTTEASQLYVRVDDGLDPAIVRDSLQAALANAGLDAHVRLGALGRRPCPVEEGVALD